MKKLFCLFAILIFFCSCYQPLFITKKNIILYKIQTKNHSGYIDQKGKLRIDTIYDICGNINSYESECPDWVESDDYAIVSKNGQFGVLNWKGEIVIPFQYKYLSDKFDKTYVFRKDKKFGIINHKNQVIVPNIFSSNYFLNDKIFPGELAGNNPWITKKVIYNPKTQKVILTFKNVDISPYYEGLAVIKTNNGKYGMLDTNGNLAIDTTYDYLGDYDKHGISARKNGQSFFMDKNENRLFNKYFSECGNFFVYNYAIVAQDKKYGIIDSVGNIVIPFDYVYLSVAQNGLFDFSNRAPRDISSYEIEKHGLINLKNDTLLKCEYDDIFTHDGVAIVEKNNLKGAYGLKQQKYLFPMKFDNIDYETDKGLSFVSYYLNQTFYYAYLNKRKKIIYSNNKALFEKLLN